MSNDNDFKHDVKAGFVLRELNYLVQELKTLRGDLREDIRNSRAELKEDIACIDDKLCDMQEKVTELVVDVTKINTKNQVWTTILAGTISIVISLLGIIFSK